MSISTEKAESIPTDCVHRKSDVYALLEWLEARPGQVFLLSSQDIARIVDTVLAAADTKGA